MRRYRPPTPCTAQVWAELAKVLGFNEFVKQAHSNKERDWFRLARDKATAHFAVLGGTYTYDYDDEPDRVIVERPAPASQVDPMCPTGECVGECDSSTHGL